MSKHVKKAQDKTKPRGARPRVGWAQAMRDMVVASINRGQLPIFGFFLVIVMLIWKMPADDVSRLVFELLTSLREAELIAYVISAILAIGWFAHSRVMRKLFSEEFERIGREKTSLQSQAAGAAYKSSDKP